MIVGPRGKLYRCSCRGIEIRLRVEADCAWLVVKKPDQEREYHDIAQSEVAGVVERFEAIGDSPEKFKAFVNARAH
jgi:hypothetical protein